MHPASRLHVMAAMLLGNLCLTSLTATHLRLLWC